MQDSTTLMTFNAIPACPKFKKTQNIKNQKGADTFSVEKKVRIRDAENALNGKWPFLGQNRHF